MALHKKGQWDEEVAHAGPPFPVEPALPMGERSALARLESWGGAPSEPDSESDEWLPELGNHMAAHAPLRAWALKRRSGLVLSLVGAIVLATVFLFLRPRTVAPVTPPSTVDVRSKTLTLGAPPVVQPLASAATGPSPAAPRPLTQPNNGVEPATPGSLPPVEPVVPVATPMVASPSSPPALRPSFRQSPSIARVVTVPGRKRAIAHPAGAVKPLPTPRPTGASEPIPPTKVLPPTRPWTDPFN